MADKRDWELAAIISRLPDEVLVGVAEVAAVTGLARVTVQQRRTPLLPEPAMRKPLRWWLGDVRQIGRSRKVEAKGMVEPRSGRRA